MRIHVVFVMLAVVACGKGKEAERNLGEDISRKFHPASQSATTILDVIKLKKRNPRSGPDTFVTLSSAAVALAGDATNTKRFTVEGSLKPCVDSWMASLDGLKNVLDPYAQEVHKRTTNTQLEFADIIQLEIEWAKHEDKILAKVCDLRASSLTCQSALRELEVLAFLEIGGPSSPCPL
jgi:hypothetical protein